jgi:hypothetical protein
VTLIVVDFTTPSFRQPISKPVTEDPVGRTQQVLARQQFSGRVFRDAPFLFVAVQKMDQH